MQRSVRYVTAPLGAAADLSNPTPASIEWDMQTVTFLLSMCFQLATLVISAVTLSQSGEPNPTPPLLIVVVVMELVVQCVEIVWYGGGSVRCTTLEEHLFQFATGTLTGSSRHQSCSSRCSSLCGTWSVNRRHSTS